MLLLTHVPVASAPGTVLSKQVRRDPEARHQQAPGVTTKVRSTVS
jgi:hypothetical protein